MNNPLWPARGDFNNDGVDDLMVTQWTDNLVSVFMNQPVLVDLELKVNRAEVDKNKDEVEFRAGFSMASLPDADDEVSATFGGVELGSVKFGDFTKLWSSIYKYRNRQLEIILDFTRNTIKVEREGVDLSQVDLKAVDIQVTIGNSSGTDNVSFKVNRDGDYVYRAGRCGFGC